MIKTKTQPTKSKKSKKKAGKKKKYKVRNWHEYNQMLVDRGRVTFWVSEDAQGNWHKVKTTGKRGAPKQYSDSAITTCLTVKALFHLTLRGTEGFINSLFEVMNVSLACPDFSTLSIRGGNLGIDIRTKTDLDTQDETINIVVDSSGAKVYGEGEWKVKKHGWQKHRTWRKFHLGIDPETKRIKATEITGNDIADCEMLETLLKQVTNPIDQAFGDGGYDKRVCYDILKELGIVAVIPPQENAKVWQHGNSKAPPRARDENLRRIREIGRKTWKEETSYHQRSLVENGIFRFKTIFGERLSARNYANQRTEVLLKCKILNQLTDIGMPQTEVVA
jgi:hypothetical protein